MPRSRRQKLYEFVGDLVEAGAVVLMKRLHLPADQARDVMLGVARVVCERNAKSTVYIPEAANLANLERNARIWSDYQLDNPAPPYTKRYTPARALELAEAHELSPQQVYNIIRHERVAEQNERQATLEGIGED